jgi:phospholipid/cholesterol/gamma-HCH transport system substrate-binding protein
MLRAYSPELTGWFDDFGHSGFPDAFGGIGRIEFTGNTFTVGAPSAGVPCNDVADILMLPGGPCQAVPASDLANLLSLKNLKRCPGANERGLSDEQLTQGGTIDCDPSQKPLGP